MKPDHLQFFIDPSRCIGCQSCVQACSECDTHRGVSMIHLEYVERSQSVQTVPVVCMHCEQPTCAEVCPADAIKRTGDGVVQSARKPRCIACGNCVVACPFGVPELSLVQINDPRSPRFAIDRDEDGLDTLLGTVRRNANEERRAMAAGLAPGQVRSGLRMLGEVLSAMDDFCRLLGRFARDDYAKRVAYRRAFVVILTTLPASLYLLFASPVKMVVAGGILQALLLPLAGFGTIYLHHHHLPAALRPSPVVTAGLWLATLVMAAAGVYGLVVTLGA